MTHRFYLLILLAGYLFPSSHLWADLKTETRMALLRGLVAEYATLKVPLPRGEKGLILKDTGQVDDKNLEREISKNGMAIAPKLLIQITNIEFDGREIQFEINGGGKKKSKWYEHIEVGMGSGTYPVGTNPNKQKNSPTGSMITLELPRSMNELTVEQTKDLLLPVLDFTPVTPLQAISKPIPPEFKEAIENKKAVSGMDRDMVLAALGPPDRKVREDDNGTEREDWIYGTPPMKVIFVTFEGDEVVQVKDYSGGIQGEAVESAQDPRQ